MNAHICISMLDAQIHTWTVDVHVDDKRVTDVSTRACMHA